MSHFKRTSKDKPDGKERNERSAQRPKRKGAKSSTNNTGERLPSIGSLQTRATEKSVTPAQAGKRKHVQPPITTALQNSFMAPWEGSSNSESSFTSIPSVSSHPSDLSPLPSPPPPPRPPALNKSSENSKSPNPPPAIRASKPSSQQSVSVKRRLLPLRGSSRPPHLPPLRKVTNLSFSRSFTFSFFELPWHQSLQNRADRLKEIVVILRKIQY
ncbi:uncharacterized protein Hap1MRO34_011099 isoform 1-T1 [Clarias gariepinus]|uniref:serine/arginine repetitive matrix protein 1 n=1 Tax=Clarias gariepinus TaxID=13013 RepID=UPI00234D9371|nr:serine/arginine repetitive matrix protein 1 [Clarias gariepinus]